jgi:hypothetical protein
MGSIIDRLVPTTRRLAPDLAIVARTGEEHVMHRLRTGGFWAAGVTGIWAAPLLAGGRPLTGPILLAGAIVAAGISGIVTTDRQLRSTATERRADFDGIAVTWLGLVSILIAGGAGTEHALSDAADHGDGWGFTLLRRTLQTAAIGNANPWDELADVGGRFELETLTDIAATMQLAGTSGAHVRSSLQTKANALRSRQTAAIERDATTRTTAMAGPTGLMVLGFVTLLLYPALTAVAAL